MTDAYALGLTFLTDVLNDAISDLESQYITTSDILALEPVDLAKRANIPVPFIAGLKQEIINQLQSQIRHTQPLPGSSNPSLGQSSTATITSDLRVSTLDLGLDKLLGGGFRPGCIHEIVGPSGSGKTQWLLSTLLSSQMPPPYGLSRPSLYLSTEHALPTQRVAEIIATNPDVQNVNPKPSLSQILTLNAQDLEVQDHILNFQLPVVIERHNIGVVVIDSIAANYRGEPSRGGVEGTAAKGGRGGQGKVLSDRSAELIRLGTLLRGIAKKYNCAIICANQVADKLGPATAMGVTLNEQRQPSQYQQQQQSYREASLGLTSSPLEQGLSQPMSTPGPDSDPNGITEEVITLDHQQRWFSGWGDSRPGSIGVNWAGRGSQKVPALGMVWSNQVSCRVALYKQMDWVSKKVNATGMAPATFAEDDPSGADWAPKRFRRWGRLVFAPWAQESDEDDPGIEYEIWSGGLRSVNGTTGDD